MTPTESTRKEYQSPVASGDLLAHFRAGEASGQTRMAVICRYVADHGHEPSRIEIDAVASRIVAAETSTGYTLR
ncbi:MAG: hypothetical protein ABH864_05955 [archaeon]